MATDLGMSAPALSLSSKTLSYESNQTVKKQSKILCTLGYEKESNHNNNGIAKKGISNAA
jgi:hypothetical protein